jgi:hypothetical protein
LSGDSLTVRTLSSELEAALLGDFPQLKKGSPDAQHFAMAFGPEAGQPWWNEESPSGPLGIAAQAVSSERRGEVDQALPLYDQVVEEGEWMGLLGLLLKGWSPAIDDNNPIHEAASKIKGLRNGHRKARLMAKLSLLALDKYESELAIELWSGAVVAAQDGTHLKRALQFEALNLGIPTPESVLFESAPDKPTDALLHPEWIDDLRRDAAMGALVRSVEDGLGGTWNYTVRMGVTPLDEAVSAELQATWLGIPWARRDIRKQIGAQLLSGAAETPQQWAYGVVMWTLGGGSRPHLTFDFAEPYLDSQGADFIVRSIADAGSPRNRIERLSAVAAQAWDLLSDETLRWLARQVRPEAGIGAPAAESRIIWAALAIRLTDEWFEKYRDLGSDVQRALLDSLAPHSMRHFDSEMKQLMYQVADDEDATEGDKGALLPLMAELVPDDERAHVQALIEKLASASVIARLTGDHPSIVSGVATSRALSELSDAIVEQSEKARGGTVGLGGRSPRIELGRLVSNLAAPDRELIDLLLDTACDEGLPAQYVAEARQGLVLLRRSDKLLVGDIDRLRSASDPGGRGPGDQGLTEGVSRAFRLQVLASVASDVERSELILAARAHDDRVRDVAINACAEALRAYRDEGLAWAVVSGLFDPSDTVASGALAGVEELGKSFEAAADVAWQRLPELFRSSSRRVRAQIVGALEEIHPESEHHRRRRAALIARGRQDRSWLVRDAASELSED